LQAKADAATANHFHGPAEDGLDLICETALQAPFIQHVKHQTWGILLLSWEESLSVLALYWLLQSLACNPEVFPLYMTESLMSAHFSLLRRWFSLILSLALNWFLKWTFPSQPPELNSEHYLCRHKKTGQALQLAD